jgi:hypothetical protein
MGEMRDKRAGMRRMAADIGTFVAALLAAIGLGSLVNFWWRRRDERAERRERRRAAEQAEELARKRAIGHEATNPRVGGILLVAVGLVAVVATGLVGLWLLFSVLQSGAQQADVPVSPLATAGQLPPMPRLQANPRADWQRVRATAEAVLGSYGQGGGAIRIPIDRAMDLIAQRGLPARSAPPPGDEQRAHELESEGGQPPVTPTAAAAGTTRNTP